MSDFSASYIIRDDKILARAIAMIRGNWVAMAGRNEAMVVHLTADSATRSQEQNRRYWALLSDIAASAWVDGRQFDKDVWHEEFRQRFLPRIDGPSGSYPVSTTSLTVKAFAHYMEDVSIFASQELGLEVC
jgi:hypothetical protein